MIWQGFGKRHDERLLFILIGYNLLVVIKKRMVFTKSQISKAGPFAN
jgi:hypothetical protein